MRRPTPGELRALILEQQVTRRVWLSLASKLKRSRTTPEETAIFHSEARKASVIESALRQWLGRMGGSF